MALPVVQSLMGHSSPNLTSACMAFSKEEMQQMIQHYVQREEIRKTSARNSFYGKIHRIVAGDIQSKVELTTISGKTVITVITNDSLEMLSLKLGLMISAEIKAPSIILQGGDKEPNCTAENKFYGRVESIKRGKITT